MTPPRETVFAEWGDAVSAIAGSPGAPTAEAIKRLIFCGDQLSVALADEEERLATETAQREAAERERDAYARTPHTCHVSGDTCGGCEYVLERDKRILAAERARDDAEAGWVRIAAQNAEDWKARLAEAQRERDAARKVAIRQADACRALRQGASPSYVHGVGTCREDAIPRERWCLYCDLAEALNL